MVHTPASIWRNPIHFLAFGFGSGASPVAPGTAGTALAVLIYLLLPTMNVVSYSLFVLASLIMGIWLCGKTSRDLGVHDHGGIVWDEFTGLWLTMLMAPPGWIYVIAGFLLFRFFDIVKPWPIRWVDRQVHGGLGIMMDDVLAGLMAMICLQLLAVWIL